MISFRKAYDEVAKKVVAIKKIGWQYDDDGDEMYAIERRNRKTMLTYRELIVLKTLSHPNVRTI